MAHAGAGSGAADTRLLMSLRARVEARLGVDGLRLTRRIGVPRRIADVAVRLRPSRARPGLGDVTDGVGGLEGLHLQAADVQAHGCILQKGGGDAGYPG
jgi:hypothetical protein